MRSTFSMNDNTIDVPQAPTARRSAFRRGIRFALIGLVFGFLGLGTAAYRMAVEADTPPPPRTKEISDVLADTIKKTADKFRRKPPAPLAAPEKEPWPVSKKLGLTASILGFSGVVLGCMSWLYGEHRRWTWAALAVGIAALAWTHVVVAVAIAIGAAIGLWLISKLG